MAAGALVATRPVMECEKGVQALQQRLKQTSVDESLIAPRERIFRSSYTQQSPVPAGCANLAAWVMENATGRFASKTAFVDGSTGASYSYSQMSELMKRTAAGFVTLGLKPKDVVLMMSPNTPDFAVVYLAVVSVGAVVAMCNPLYTEADVAKHLALVDAKFVVTVPELLNKFNTQLPVILMGDEGVGRSAGVSYLSEMFARDDYTEAPPQECDPDDTCTLLFTSGTTGLSKAVQITHHNFMAAVVGYNALDAGATTTADDVCFAVIPMYHVYGLGMVFLATLQRGATVVTMARYSLPAMLQCIERFKVTMATLVPPIYVALVKSADLVGEYDLSSLSILATGAAPLREDTMKAILAMFPHCGIRQGYGMTECPLVSFSVAANERQQRGSVGPLIAGTEARISHLETSASLPAMATGEIWIRGPQVMKDFLMMKRELPMAFVVKRNGLDISDTEVMSFVGKLVAPYKKVRKVEFIGAIPRSNTGKILRKELTQRIISS